MNRARIVRLSLLCAGLIGPGAARAAGPSVESVVPAVVARGGEATPTLAGGHLRGACEVVWYGPGLACRRLDIASDEEARITVAASADCPPGKHPFRVRTPGGLSELRVIQVSRFPVVAEAEPNDAPKDARAVPLNTTVTGVIETGDIDGVAVALRRGGRLSAEVEAVRAGGGELTDAVLIVLGPDGREVARVDDTDATGQDPCLTLVAPADGTYTVQVRDGHFGGGSANSYLLHVGDFPRPSAVLPPGGEAGKPARLRLEGPDGPLGVELVDLPRDAGPWWDYVPTLDGRPAPTPTRLRIAPYPAVEEGVAPADAAWPVAFHGAVASPGEEDSWTIRARSGDAVRAEVFAARVGSRLDAVLRVFDPAGDPVAFNDDDETHDSLVEFRARAGGAYRLAVSDKRKSGGPPFFYRLEVDRPRPALTLFLAGPARKSQERQVVAVPRGNRVIAWIGARRDGCTGPVKVDLDGLPPGVTADLAGIPADAYLTPVVFTAAADAPLGATLAGVRGEVDSPGGPVAGTFLQTVDLLPGPGDSSYQSVGVDRLAVVVTEPAPYSVTLARPANPLTRDGSVGLVATVGRTAGFDEDLEVSLPYLPPGVEMEGPVVVPRGETRASLVLNARPDADPTPWRLAAEVRPAPPRRDRRDMAMAQMNQLAGGGGGGRRRTGLVAGLPPVASPLVPFALAPSAVSGRFAAKVVEQGSTGVVACSLEAHGIPLAGLTATLEGLPPRATSAPVRLAGESPQVEFAVTVDPTTPAGELASLACRLDGVADGQPFSYRVGRGGVLKVTPPGGAAVDASGKPLSPLDALRRREQPRP